MLSPIFYRLPDEILNEIFLIHWKNMFKNVISQLDSIKLFCKKLKNLFPFNSYKKNLVNNYKLIFNINKNLKTIFLDKGSRLYCKNIDRTLYNIKPNHKIFSNKNIGMTYQYLCSKSGLMRYYIYNDYTLLTDLNEGH